MKKTVLYKYSGAGNDFVVIDGRGEEVSAFREVARIEALCKAYKTDGLMILGPGDAGVDFTMEFYNPDGSGGMMCGNGGRCIVAFADYLGIRPAGRFLHPSGVRNDKAASPCQPGEVIPCQPEEVIPCQAEEVIPSQPEEVAPSQPEEVIPCQAEEVAPCPSGRSEGSYLFRAPDGLHTGEILERPEDGLWTVRIKMIDVQGITPMLDGYFLDTGTRHFVKFVPDVEKVDVDAEGKALRWDPAFAPVGTNVNFVHVAPDGLHVRTFEKGVEGETLACGTGLTACALAAYHTGVPSYGAPVASLLGKGIPGTAKEFYRLRARRDWLSVDFTPGADDRFTGVFLTGPARLVH